AFRGFPPDDGRVGAVLDAFSRAARAASDSAPAEGEPFVNPFILALFADLFVLDPGLTADHVRDARPELVYLIQRVLLRIPLELNWTLLYGVVPRRLTQEFFEQILYPQVQKAL